MTTSPNASAVQQCIVIALTKIGLADKFDPFRLFVTDGISYNVAAYNNLRAMYTRLEFIICYAHMQALLGGSVSVKYEDVNDEVKIIKKVFEKCPRRVEEWTNFGVREKLPLPVLTRWGTWITSVEYLSKHYTAMKNFLISIPVNESKAARKTTELMEDANVVRDLGFIASLSFLTQKIKVCQESG